MQEVGYYDLKEFLILKGVLSESEKSISKSIFKNYGFLPKSYVKPFEEKRQAHEKTKSKKQGRKTGKDAWSFPTEDEQREREAWIARIDFSQIAQDCGEFYFFPKICKERQSIEPKQLFENSVQIGEFIRRCFLFSEQICDYVVQQYLKGGYGGLFGDFKIPFEAFKRDLLGTFKDHNFKLPKAFCQLEPYCVDEDLVFAITPSHAKNPALPKQSLDHFYKFITQEEKNNRADLGHLVDVLCKNPLDCIPSHKEKRLMRLWLERDCGFLEFAHMPRLERALKDAHISFASVLTSQKKHGYYFPIVFKLWACARLKDLFKKREFASTLEVLYEKLHKGQDALLAKLEENSKPDVFWSCVHNLLSNLELPLRVLAQKEAWQVEKVPNFFPLAISLNQKPTPIYEIRALLMLDNPGINKDSLSTQSEQVSSILETTQGEWDELDEWMEYRCSEAYLQDQERFSRASEEDINPSEPLYTPKTLYRYLEGVSGQEEAKKALCVTMSDHYASFMGQPRMPKTNMLLIGPSGSGKTFMTTMLLKKLDIPYFIADASNLTPTGWKGEELISIFVGLYVSAGKDIEKAQKGVIFLDEVDKLGMEVTNEQFKSLVQTELLKPIEEHAVTFTYDKQDITLKTDEILFIFAGHFKDLYTSLNTTTQPKNSIGFTNTKPTPPSTTLQEVSNQDLQRCGLFREFIGRIGNVVVLEPVDHKMLSDAIPQELKPSQDHFREHGSVLEIDEGAKELLIEKAMQEGTGMRAIKTLLNRVIHLLRFDMEKWRGYKCVITAETITNKKEPKKIPLNAPKKKG
ncbi:AAA family ATPase [Helicobacter labacensis]|uniref:AAA family ATPase n=1 Tax=Helicobacter labacensis TaxID=2316079 RepID=UPI000EAE7C83|nr:AAA family ATPase [Helicobacter labacensis]